MPLWRFFEHFFFIVRIPTGNNDFCYKPSPIYPIFSESYFYRHSTVPNHFYCQGRKRTAGYDCPSRHETAPDLSLRECSTSTWRVSSFQRVSLKGNHGRKPDWKTKESFIVKPWLSSRFSWKKSYNPVLNRVKASFSLHSSSRPERLHLAWL